MSLGSSGVGRLFPFISRRTRRKASLYGALNSEAQHAGAKLSRRSECCGKHSEILSEDLLVVGFKEVPNALQEMSRFSGFQNGDRR